MGLKKLVDLDRLSRFKDKILALIPQIDTTLTQQGQAADAKATGNAIAGKYNKPSGGIPNSDLAEDAQRGYTVDYAEKGTLYLENFAMYDFDIPDLITPLPGGEPLDAIIVTIDGVEALLPRTTALDDCTYQYGGDPDPDANPGDYDFIEYPAVIRLNFGIDRDKAEIYMPPDGVERSISINAAVNTLTSVSPEFEQARGYTDEKRYLFVPEQTVTTSSKDAGLMKASLTPVSTDTYFPQVGDKLSVTINGEAKEIVGVSSQSFSGAVFVFSGELSKVLDGLVALWVHKGGTSGNLDVVDLFTFEHPANTYTVSAERIISPVTTSDFDNAVEKSTETAMAATAAAIAGKLDAGGDAYRAASIPMGQLDSSSTATAMTATIDGITELRDGVCMWLKNGVITSAANFTININGLGAKPCYSSLAAATRVTTAFSVNYTMLMVYNSTRVDGGCWDIVYGYDTNTTYTPPKLGFGYGTCSTAAATVAKTASISGYTLVAGGIVAIKFDNNVPAGATLNINSKGAKAIYYKGAAITAGVIKAGDTVTMIYSTYYHVLSIDRDIPSPSVDTTQEISIIDGYIGNSTDYARADHTHYFDIANAIENVSALNIPVFLYDGQNGVYIPYTPRYLGNAYQHQNKMNFALVVPPNYDSYPVLFTPSKFDTATGELHLTGIVGGVLYEATLLPGADPTGESAGVVMVGTMTTTNLALPSAQGVSF